MRAFSCLEPHSAELDGKIFPPIYPCTLLSQHLLQHTMAQGNTKGLKAKATSGGRKKGGTMQKGRRDIKPKNAQKVAERQHHKVCGSLFVSTDLCSVPRPSIASGGIEIY